MSVVKELIIKENSLISFGNYELNEKAKKSDFIYNKDSYKIKTFKDITRLEKNDKFLFESVPGTAVHSFKEDENGMEFTIEGEHSVEVTLGLLPEEEYKVFLQGKEEPVLKTNLGGKLTISLDLKNEGPIKVKVVK